MFCQSCLTTIRAVTEDLQSTDAGEESSKILHESLTKFHQSVMAQCWICRKLWKLLVRQQESDSDSAEQLSMSPGTLAVWQNSLVQLTVVIRPAYLELSLKIFQPFVGEMKYLYSRYSHFILSPNPRCMGEPPYPRHETSDGDTSTIRKPWLWKYWLDICSKSHQRCRELDHKSKQFVPSRLLEISTNNDGVSFDWKLVLGNDLGNTLYTTLSHCWGTSQHAITTKENYQARMRPASSSELPKTFQHAFYIAFKLGFHLIWIDSLCIIQDDEDDWLTQASMMGSIYEGASCNIAATWAPDGDGGCFTTKEPRTVSLNFPPGHTWEYYVDDTLLYYKDLMEATLNSRGWVTQERYLAGRQLSFAKSQVYWECRELTASEQYPNGIPKSLMDMSPYNQAKPPDGKPTLDYSNAIQRRTAWAGLIYFYSNCKFTKISDKMIALAGLASKMRLIEEDTYLAGLWKKNIENQLCWITDDDVRRRDNRRRIQPYEAPTWSWASMDGPVISDQNYLDGDQYKSLIEVLDVCVHSKHESKLHSFTPSSLVLRGIAVWAQPKLLQHQGFRFEDDCWILQCTGLQNDGSTTDINASIIWDENISISDVDVERRASLLAARESNLLFMLVKYDILDYDPRFIGLVLRQQRFPADDVSYTRIGVFLTHDKNPLGILAVRLGYISSYPFIDVAGLQSTNLSRFVHTAVIF